MSRFRLVDARALLSFARMRHMCFGGTGVVSVDGEACSARASVLTLSLCVPS